MDFKKFMRNCVCLSMLALTVPVNFSVASECSTGCGCPVQKMVTPETASCDSCNKVLDENGCEQELTTGAAANIDGKKYKFQKYAYPDAVYSNSNTSTVGSLNNNATITDGALLNRGLTVQNGVLVTDGCMTGAAATIDETKAIDEILDKTTDCCDKSVSVKSPTHINVTKKVLESYEPNNVTGFASNLGQMYPDVPSSHWASSDINRLTEKCVLFGYPDGMFRPNSNVTRAEMASAVVRGYNLENTAMGSDGDFRDVPESHWAYEFINKSANSDFIDGHANGLFDPNGKITTVQALVIVSKGLNCPMDKCKADEILSQYKDGHLVPAWARESVAKAIENGALKDMNSSYIHPNKTASRAQIATMIQNIRIAGGYDTENKVASSDVVKSFVEKEQCVQIPTLELRMNDIINAKNANVGEQFAATTINPIVIDGMTFAKGSRVNGKVVEIIRPTKNNQGAIRLSFDEIVGCDGKKYALPKQILTAHVDKNMDSNGFVRAIEWPFTWVGSILGNVGRSAGGMVIGLANASENLLGNTGTGSAELLTGKFRASGRSFQDAGKALVMAPIDLTRNAISGTMGIFQTTADEIAYLVDPSGMRISQVNPEQKITIAFGE